MAYALARFSKLATDSGRFFDYEEVWRRQAVPEALRSNLVAIAQAMQRVLLKPAAGMANVTQWAKRQACWHQAAQTEAALSEVVRGMLVDAAEQRITARDAKKSQKTDDAIGAQALAVQFGHRGWKAALVFAQARKLLSPLQRGILSTFSAPGRLPSEKQSVQLVAALRTLEAEGYVAPAA